MPLLLVGDGADFQRTGHLMLSRGWEIPGVVNVPDRLPRGECAVAYPDALLGLAWRDFLIPANVPAVAKLVPHWDELPDCSRPRG
jgi:hypothetical protein